MADEALMSRTNAKLRYAKVHLDELKVQPIGRGHDFERAHHEAIFAQLFGGYAALFQELNVDLGCGLSLESVTLGNMRNALKNQGRASPKLAELYQLETDPSSWLAQAKAMRDHTAHISGIPLVFYAGGIEDGLTSFRHPKSLDELPGDVIDTLLSWWSEMENLVHRMRY